MDSLENKILEEQHNITSACTECCHDHLHESSPMSKLYLTVSGGSASIHAYLFNNIAKGDAESLPTRQRTKT